ncbi:MAG: M1 family aminopeptidase [Bacteroidota bacterium]
MRLFPKLIYWVLGGLTIALVGRPLPSLAQLAGPEAHKANGVDRYSLLGAYPDKDDNHDIAFYGLNLEVFPQSERIAGSTRIRTRVVQATDSLELDLVSDLTVDSVVSASGQRLNFDRFNKEPDWILTIHLPRIYNQGEVTDLTIYYQGAPRSTGFGSFTFSESGGSPAIWTLSEPLGAKNWFPVKDTPADKADSAWVFVTVPKPLIAASTGLLTDQVDLPNDRTRYEWKTQYPIAQYLISLAIANYQYYEETFTAADGTTMPVVNYIFPDANLNSIRNQTSITRDLLALYSDRFGPYPFLEEKYGHAQFGWGGGMEHQTLSSMGSFSLQLVSHELAHQWFGDAVTCETWQDIWLNEGFASYSEGLAIEHLEGQEAFYDWLHDVYQQVAVTDDGQVYIPAGEIDPNAASTVDRIFNYRLTYLKGASVVHMLRFVMGDEAFYNALKDYVGNQYAYSTAKTDDLQSLLESYHGESLQVFFDQWVYSEGYPNYTLRYNILAQREEAQIRVELSDQPSHPSVDHFEMPVPIRFYTQSDAGRITQDTTIQLRHTEQVQEWTLQLPFVPSKIEFDPRGDILRGFLTVEQMDSGVWGAEKPKQTKLLNNFPNPFNARTTIPFQLPTEQYVTIDVFNLYGRHVATLFSGRKSAGEHIVRWNAQQYASGIYYVRLSDGRQNYTQKITLLK